MEGVYVEFNTEASENNPVAALHVAELAEPPMLPFNVTVPPAQTDWFEPASAEGLGVTVSSPAFKTTFPRLLVNTGRYK